MKKFTGTILRLGVADNSGDIFDPECKITYAGKRIPILNSNDPDRVIGEAELWQEGDKVLSKVCLVKGAKITEADFVKGTCSVSGQVFERQDNVIKKVGITHISWPEENADPEIKKIEDWEEEK